MEIKTSARIASGLLALGVGCGAFGAHALKGAIEPDLLTVYEKGVFYHLVHALGLLIVAILANQNLIGKVIFQRVSLLLISGITIFSGSLYILAITSIKWLGAITPIGGVAFIVAWVVLALEVGRSVET